MGGERMTQRVTSGGFRNTGGLDRGLDDLLQHRLVQVVAPDPGRRLQTGRDPTVADL